MRDGGPDDCMRYFEELSRDLRMRKYILEAEPMEEKREVPPRLKEADHRMQLYKTIQCLYEPDDPYTDESPADKNLLEDYALLMEARVGICKSDLYNIYMGMRYLAKKEPVVKLRLWGIIKGTKKKYIVIEARLSDKAIQERLEVLEKDKTSTDDLEEVQKRGVSFKGMKNLKIGTKKEGGKKNVKAENTDKEDERNQDDKYPPVEEKNENENEEPLDVEPVITEKRFPYTFPPVPKAEPTEIPTPPEEPLGEGANRFVYYVSADPTEPWTALPNVTPQQIVVSRKIQKFFTGNLEREIVSFPDFPGKEQELLRSVIARISASTHVSPAGFYLGPSEEEAMTIEEGEMYIEDPDYEPLSRRNLLDLDFWAHHEKCLLSHGTTTAWKPQRKSVNEVMAEEMMEEEEQMDEIELPPEILSPLSEDKMEEDIGNTRPWTTRLTSPLMEENSPVMITSDIWQGAVAVTKGKKFLNFYSGWGFKTRFRNYNPPSPGDIQNEYPKGPEIMEMTDPSAQMEEFRWQMLHPPPRVIGEEFGEEEDEEDEGSND